MASFLRASDSSRSSFWRSSISAVTRAGTSSSVVLAARRPHLRKLDRASFDDAAARHARSAPRCGARRTPTALSPDHRDQADIAGAPHMRAAAQLDRLASALLASPCRPVPPIDTTRTSSPYFSPNSAMRALRDRSSTAISRVVTGAILQHDIVGDVLDPREFVGVIGLWMGEVEAQAVGRDQRALLRDMVAQHLAQRLVQQDASPNGWRGLRCGARDRPPAPAPSPA